MQSSVPAAIEIEGERLSFDGPVGRRIIETHIWAVREGLRGASAYDLFDGYCQRLVIHGVPLWRAYVAMETLHPQWSGYGFTWRRDLNAIHPEQYARSDVAGQDWLNSPMYDLICRARAGEDNPQIRRHLEVGRSSEIFRCWSSFSAKEQPTILARSSHSEKPAILPRAPGSFIPLLPTDAAVSIMTIRR